MNGLFQSKKKYEFKEKSRVFLEIVMSFNYSRLRLCPIILARTAQKQITCCLRSTQRRKAMIFSVEFNQSCISVIKVYFNQFLWPDSFYSYTFLHSRPQLHLNKSGKCGSLQKGGLPYFPNYSHNQWQFDPFYLSC